ncbi:MAG TPA: hypothetical protein VFD83_05490, partial [Candidatus Polarisedimenticolia bacterium]|nr:hypothetical protein [Candidatus Polarisedimenticolia bacterium]
MNVSPRGQAVIEAASLVLGPGLMSVGDLLHPPESWDAAAQVAIVAKSTSRWYTAHLLLFVGMLLLVPGLLAITRLVGIRRPAIGYAARLLVLVSVGAFSAVTSYEMLLGSFLSQGADPTVAVKLVQALQSGVMMVLLPFLLAFFVGTLLAVVPLASRPGPLRLPALALGLG